MLRESETTTGERVIVQGIGNSFVSVPFHKVSLESNLVHGNTDVGVVSNLPMRGISMLLGNDLAGGKVVRYPWVVSKPSVSKETEKIEERHPGVFPSYAVTRAKSKQKNAKINSDDGLSSALKDWSTVHQLVLAGKHNWGLPTKCLWEY